MLLIHLEAFAKFLPIHCRESTNSLDLIFAWFYLQVKIDWETIRAKIENEEQRI